jgi:hypothetical protein
MDSNLRAIRCGTKFKFMGLGASLAWAWRSLGGEGDMSFEILHLHLISSTNPLIPTYGFTAFSCTTVLFSRSGVHFM